MFCYPKDFTVYFFQGPYNEEADNDAMEYGRKRKQGLSGWCRICRVDCYTVQGLEDHSKTEEHNKKTLELVMSIKQDGAKKQKQCVYSFIIVIFIIVCILLKF